MKQLIIGLILGLILGATVLALADGSYLSVETIFNRVFNSSSNTLSLRGV